MDALDQLGFDDEWIERFLGLSFKRQVAEMEITDPQDRNRLMNHAYSFRGKPAWRALKEAHERTDHYDAVRGRDLVGRACVLGFPLCGFCERILYGSDDPAARWASSLHHPHEGPHGYQVIQGRELEYPGACLPVCRSCHLLIEVMHCLVGWLKFGLLEKLFGLEAADSRSWSKERVASEIYFHALRGAYRHMRPALQRRWRGSGGAEERAA